MSECADVVIVGAGVMGASIAYRLAVKRAGRIVVIKRDTVASGASGRSSALVRMDCTFPPEVLPAVKSLEYFQNWSEWQQVLRALSRTGPSRGRFCICELVGDRGLEPLTFSV